MVRVAKSFVDRTLWPEFEPAQALLHEHFAAVTKRVIARAVGRDDADVEVREGPTLEP
jgi:hypothetical protein